MKSPAFILSAVALTAICSCAPKQEGRSLIVYYSVTGTTEKVAELFWEKTGADIVRIVATKPYDTEFSKIVDSYMQEMEQGVTRDIEPLEVNIEDYDMVYIGTPVWCGNCAGPVETFLKDCNLKGKTVIPFCTFGSGGNTAVDMVRRLQPEAVIPAWYGVRAARLDKAAAEIDAFLVGIGVLSGEMKVLPEFSESHELTEQDSAIFNEACGNYPMPLGNPTSVASRETDNDVEYVFKSEVKGLDGKDSIQTIFVSKGKGDGSVAEFTQVVR